MIGSVSLLLTVLSFVRTIFFVSSYTLNFVLWQDKEVLAIYICQGSISRIEDGQRTVTDIELYDLSQVLGVSIGSLFEERE